MGRSSTLGGSIQSGPFSTIRRASAERFKASDIDWSDMEKVRAAAIVTWAELVEFATEAYTAAGVPPADARKAAEGIVDADLHGTVTHGLKNLRNYVSLLLGG